MLYLDGKTILQVPVPTEKATGIIARRLLSILIFSFVRG